MEAYQGRGGDDPYGSHDLEDVISVLAGRPGCVEEVKAAGEELAHWLASQMEHVFPEDRRVEIVSGHLSPTAPIGLVRVVTERISRLAQLRLAS